MRIGPALYTELALAAVQSVGGAWRAHERLAVIKSVCRVHDRLWEARATCDKAVHEERLVLIERIKELVALGRLELAQALLSKLQAQVAADRRAGDAAAAELKRWLKRAK